MQSHGIWTINKVKDLQQITTVKNFYTVPTAGQGIQVQNNQHLVMHFNRTLNYERHNLAKHGQCTR